MLMRRRMRRHAYRYEYGVDGPVLDWLIDYLTNRSQRTKIKESFSTILISNFGVPQGSLLGPWRFTVLINDLKLVTNCDLLILHADDSLVAV